MSAASPVDRLPEDVCEVQQTEQRRQQVSELWEQSIDASMPADHAAHPGPAAHHQIPALLWTKQPAAELLQTGRDCKGSPRGRPVHTARGHQGDPAASEQWEDTPISRDIELLCGQKPSQSYEDNVGNGGTAARTERS